MVQFQQEKSFSPLKILRKQNSYKDSFVCRVPSVLRFWGRTFRTFKASFQSLRVWMNVVPESSVTAPYIVCHMNKRLVIDLCMS